MQYWVPSHNIYSSLSNHIDKLRGLVVHTTQINNRILPSHNLILIQKNELEINKRKVPRRYSKQATLCPRQNPEKQSIQFPISSHSSHLNPYTFNTISEWYHFPWPNSVTILLPSFWKFGTRMCLPWVMFLLFGGQIWHILSPSCLMHLYYFLVLFVKVICSLSLFWLIYGSFTMLTYHCGKEHWKMIVLLPFCTKE